ncbi:MAG: DUF2508 family protein [Lactobacillaceae bacterium]|jgi:hypothetical protein|nr:DUF2508 family protein [Lactobacillaceae bacterium]
MIFGRKKQSLEVYSRTNILTALDKLQRDYQLARENERNLINANVDLRQLRSKTAVMRNKYSYLIKMTKEFQNEK